MRVATNEWIRTSKEFDAVIDFEVTGNRPDCMSVLGMALVKKQFFPVSDRPEVLVEVQMPYGTSIEQTSATVAKPRPSQLAGDFDVA